MNAQGWGREGKRRWHFYREGMPICHQRPQYREHAWRYGGLLRSDPTNLHPLCKECLFFVDAESLPKWLQGKRPEDEDAVADRQIKLARIEQR
jgi:hypothetical protein